MVVEFLQDNVIRWAIGSRFYAITHTDRYEGFFIVYGFCDEMDLECNVNREIVSVDCLFVGC